MDFVKDPVPSSTLWPAPWRSSNFMNDGKFRRRERYQRSGAEDQLLHYLSTTRQVSYIVIPDAACWRQYQGLLYHLVTEQRAMPVLWVLLESAAEALDYRNQAPVRNGMAEAAAIQERQRLQRLAQDNGVASNGNVAVIPDLTLRWLDDDELEEWNVFDYPKLDVEHRSRFALHRIARLVNRHHQSDVTVVQAETVAEQTLDDAPGIQMLDVAALIEKLQEEALVTVERAVELRDLADECLEAYRLRNGPDHLTKIRESEWTAEQVAAGLRDKILIGGKLQVSDYNPKEAFVLHQNEKWFVDVAARHNGAALHGDRVAALVLPPSEWGRPVGRQWLVYQSDQNDGIDDSTDAVATSYSGLSQVQSARVVGVLSTGRRTFVATIMDRLANDDDHVALVVPRDVRIPRIRLRTRKWAEYAEKRLLVEIDGFDPGSQYPHGRCIDVLGDVGDLDTEISCLLHENEIKFEPFSATALSVLPPEGHEWKIPSSQYDTRKDLRTNRRVFSVDPPGCQDIDDTMHAHVLPNGDLEIGVHIADVTFFVPHGSSLDIEAKSRGTTFYLVDRRFDMLPALFSTDLCSLHENVDRLAVSVIWIMSPDLNQVKDTWYGRTIIQNCAAMTYGQADRILDRLTPETSDYVVPPPLTAGAPVDRSLVPRLRDDLELLTSVARTLRSNRETRGGAIDLSSAFLGNELKFKIVEGTPVEVKPKDDKEIHRTIEELMILANASVAERIHRYCPDTALVRIHRTVDEERLDDLNEVLDAAGLCIEGTSNASLALTLQRADSRSGPTTQALFRSLATRAMAEAQYVCTGTLALGSDFSHYGLGLEKYTHFTSPIRRYADIVVHKQLLYTLEENEPLEQLSMTQVSFVNVDMPESHTPSVLSGEALRISREDGSSEYAGSSLTIANRNVLEQPHRERHDDPYDSASVAIICQYLNLRSREAKRSATECQKLFLTLYFRHRVEVVDAVVTRIATNGNGFWVFIPQFDLRAPVFVTDRARVVNLDPTLLSLPKEFGTAPSQGFDEPCRQLPGWHARIVKENDNMEALLVFNPATETRLHVRVLDKVLIHVSCPNLLDRARLPRLRAQLVSAQSTTPHADRKKPGSDDGAIVLRRRIDVQNESFSSFYGHCNVPASSRLLKEAASSSDKIESDYRLEYGRRLDRFSGRVTFNGFSNPDLRSNRMLAAQESATSDVRERRSQISAVEKQQMQVDSSRAVSARQDRLAAEKRNSRRAKQK